jgi:hypothetical protein
MPGVGGSTGVCRRGWGAGRGMSGVCLDGRQYMLRGDGKGTYAGGNWGPIHVYTHVHAYGQRPVFHTPRGWRGHWGVPPPPPLAFNSERLGYFMVLGDHKRHRLDLHIRLKPVPLWWLLVREMLHQVLQHSDVVIDLTRG